MVSAAALDDAYRERLRRLAAYEVEWWLSDPWVADAVAGDPGLANEIVRIAAVRTVQTIDVHKRPTWSLRRALLHAMLLADLQTKVTPGPPIAAVLTLGLPASGKSSMLRRIARAWAGSPEAAVLDADALRVRLPEYGDGRGSGVVQDETADVTYGPYYERLLDGPATEHPFLVVDTVGDPVHLPATARRLRTAGWPVAALLTQLPIDEALARARARAVDDGRIVDEGYLRDRHGVPALGLRSLLDAGLLDAGWAVIDTSVPPGEPPRVLEGDGRFGINGETTPFW